MSTLVALVAACLGLAVGAGLGYRAGWRAAVLALRELQAIRETIRE